MVQATDVNIRMNGVDNASAAINRTAKSINKMANQTSRSSGFMVRHRRVVQQAGFQIGDFATQIAGGQSAMLAFTQQGGQLLQIFGPFGAAAAGALSVLGAMAIAFTRGSSEAKSFKDMVDDLGSSLKDYEDFVDGAVADTEKLAEKFGAGAEEARKLYQILAVNKRLQLAESASSTLGKATDPFGIEGQMKGLQAGLVASFFGVERPFLVFGEAARKARDELDALLQAAIDTQNAMASADGLDEQINAANKALVAFSALADLDGARNAKEVEYIALLGDTILKLREIQKLDADLASSLEKSGASVGKAIADGLALGMADGQSAVNDAAAKMASGAIETVKTRFGVQSPSKVMREIGQFLTEGLEIGVEENLGAFKSAFDGVFDAILDKGKSVTDALRSLGRDLLNLVLRTQVFGLLGQVFPNVFGENGAIPVSKFAQGGIVSRPTPFANGTAVMGERGAEAILPLTRTPGGDLGVKSMGGGSNVTVQIINNSGAQVQHETSTNGDGSRLERVIIDAVARETTAGGLDSALAGRFGTRPMRKVR